MGPRIARVFWPQGIKVLLTLGVRHQVSRVTLGLVVMLVIKGSLGEKLPSYEVLKMQ